jgi:DNA-directed RNA polymerase specialized sigma24 family protein
MSVPAAEALERYTGDVGYYVRRYAHSLPPDDGDDLRQEVVVGLLRAARKARGWQRTYFCRWMRGAALNYLLARRRHMVGDVVADALQESTDWPETVILTRLKWQAIVAAAALSPEQAAALANHMRRGIRDGEPRSVRLNQRLCIARRKIRAARKELK